MIIQQIMDTFFALIKLLITFLPNPDTLPSQIGDAFITIGSYWDKANYFFPLDTTFTIFALILALELSVLTFEVVNWAYDKLRGAG